MQDILILTDADTSTITPRPCTQPVPRSGVEPLAQEAFAAFMEERRPDFSKV